MKSRSHEGKSRKTLEDGRGRVPNRENSIFMISVFCSSCYVLPSLNLSPFFFFLPPLGNARGRWWAWEQGQHRENWKHTWERGQRRRGEVLMTSSDHQQTAPLSCFSVMEVSKASSVWLGLCRHRLLLSSNGKSPARKCCEVSGATQFQSSLARASPDHVSPSLPYSHPPDSAS